MLTIQRLLCEYQETPLGIDFPSVRLSWEISSDRRGTRQLCYHVQVSGRNGGFVWDSGIVESEDVWCIVPESVRLRSRERYFWNVEVVDDGGIAAFASSWWEMGLLNREDWLAGWIEPEQPPVYREPDISMAEMFAALERDGKIPFDYNNIYPCQYLRREFVLEHQPEQARVYITAHGIYRLEINGQRVSEDEFAPGYTAYDKYLSYQTYDVTSFLKRGKNAVGAILADGWYAGRIGGSGENCQYGERLGLLMQMEIHMEDGSKETVLSDGAFVSATGPLCYSDIFIGERYDARLEIPGWSTADFDCTGWKPVNCVEGGFDPLVAEYGEPVRGIDVIPAVDVVTTPKGETVIDFGQVIAGRVIMEVSGPAGTEVELEHSEVLDEEGNFINNIQGRYKDQKDVYVLKGEGTECYEPRFTFHGFRYARIVGYPGQVSKESFRARVLSSALKQSGSFACSNEDLNQLQRNIMWSLRGNTLSIPTDCPQRERAGWTGDVQIIGETACDNLQIMVFFDKWLRNAAAEQTENGQIPIIVPFLPGYHKAAHMPLANDILPDNCTSAGWGDVVTVLPWNLYQQYGDMRVLERYYENMIRWVEYIRGMAENHNPGDLNELTSERAEHMKYLWNTNFHFGDWLTPSVSLNPETGEVDMERSARLTNHYVPTCFYAASTEIAAKAARLLDRTEDAERYEALLEKIKAAFAYEYMDESGNLKINMQGFHVLALHFGLVPEQYEQHVADNLAALIRKNGNRLDTGFLSVPYLLDVLVKYGKTSEAFALLYQDQCPSWLYEIRQGATTIWESWQGILPNGRVGKASYNHYAFGCVGAWMYRELGGLKMTSPGYRTIEVAPISDSGLTWAETTRHTVYGEIAVKWENNDGAGYCHVEIPVGTTAAVHIPANTVFENGQPVAAGNGVLEVAASDERTIILVGSGSYTFAF